MNKPLLLILLLCAFTACSSVEIHITELPEGKVALKSIESGLFNEKAKAVVTFSPKQGGQIENILWQGEKLLYKNAVEQFPNKETDFQKVKAQLTNDGESLIVTNRQRGLYQLRRSYSMKYNEELNEYCAEVIYTVKNYSSKNQLSYQWLQLLSLNEKLLPGEKSGQWQFIASDGAKVRFNIEFSGIEKLHSNSSTEQFGTLLTTSTQKNETLKPKQRLSWKVLYRLQELEN